MSEQTTATASYLTWLEPLLIDEEIGQRTMAELLDSLLVTAIAGGSTHWCESILFNGTKPKAVDHGEDGGPWYAVAFRAGALPLQVVPDDDATIALTLDMAINGLRLLLEGQNCHGGVRADLLDNKGCADADTADVWLQLAVFGDVVYG